MQVRPEQHWVFDVQDWPVDAQFIVTDFVKMFPTAPLESFGWTWTIFVPVVVKVYGSVKSLSALKPVQPAPKFQFICIGSALGSVAWAVNGIC